MANTVLPATSNVRGNVAQANSNVTGTQTTNNVVTPVQTPTQANTQGQNNISPVTIPIQIQPVVGNQPVQAPNINNLQTNNNTVDTTNLNKYPIPQQTQQTQQSRNNISFDQIYQGYQSQYGTNPSNVNQVKQSSFGTTIVTPTTTNINTVEGQYQSAYADTINSLISEMLTRMNTGFEYDPYQDNSLKMATEYAANSTLQSLAGSGILNSSSTAERVARIVSELIPQYEEKAHNRWIEYLGQLADTAQIVMTYDSHQFEQWKDAKDRQFEREKFDFEKDQKALENAWKRVDELGYVDNEASALLGVAVGTLSKDAREAKEQREYELKRMREQLEIEHANNVAITKLKSELDYSNSQKLAELNSRLEMQQYKEKAAIDLANSKDLAKYQAELSKKYSSSGSRGSSGGGSTGSTSQTLMQQVATKTNGNMIKDTNGKLVQSGNVYYLEYKDKNGNTSIASLTITKDMTEQDIRDWASKYNVTI